MSNKPAFRIRSGKGLNMLDFSPNQIARAKMPKEYWHPTFPSPIPPSDTSGSGVPTIRSDQGVAIAISAINGGSVVGLKARFFHVGSLESRQLPRGKMLVYTSYYPRWNAISDNIFLNIIHNHRASAY
jgi:hypothetical protein